MAFVIACIVAAICAVGWLTRYISCAALIYYLELKGYKNPSDSEMKECTQFVVKHLFNR